jgi:hypothetical protein
MRLDLMASIIALATDMNLENWALFEPFKVTSPEVPILVRPDDVDLQEACRLLGLRIDGT